MKRIGYLFSGIPIKKGFVNKGERRKEGGTAGQNSTSKNNWGGEGQQMHHLQRAFLGDGKDKLVKEK